MDAAARQSPDSTPAPPHRADFSLIYQRRGQLWTFAWPAGEERAMFEAVIALASAEHAAFDWFDAAAVSHGIAQAVLEAAQGPGPSTALAPAASAAFTQNPSPRTSV